VLIEPHYVCKDFRNLYTQFYSKNFLARSSHCARLHLFARAGLSATAGFVVAEVVLDATASLDECRYVYLRAGRASCQGDQWREAPNAPEEFRLYTNNLGERDV